MRELEPGEFEERASWARRQGHPGYVWPEVPPSAWRRGLRRLETLAREVLAGGTPSLEADASSVEARALGVAAFTSRLGPLVGYWIESGVVGAADPARSLFLSHLRHGRERAAIQREHLSRLAQALNEAGIEPVVVKSAHTARVYFPDAGARPAVDVDLVVGESAFERAESALRAAGFVLAVRQRRPPKSDWLPPGVDPLPRSLDVLHSGSHYGVDLQSTLARNFFGVRTVRVADVADDSTRRAPELGPGLRALEQPALLAYHALHASEGPTNLTLIRLVELVLMARRDFASGALDRGELVRLLDRTGGARFAYPALALAERLAPNTFGPDVLGPLEAAATPRMRAVVAALSPGEAQASEVLSLAARFMWCASPADYVRRTLHMLAPAPAGRSLRRLAGMYLDRGYRLLRGRVRYDLNSINRARGG